MTAQRSSRCPWYVSAAAVRAWQRLVPSAPRSFDAASDALIELCAEVWAERYADGEREPDVTRTGAYIYEAGRRHGRVRLVVSAERRAEGGLQQLVDVVARSTNGAPRGPARPARRGRNVERGGPNGAPSREGESRQSSRPEEPIPRPVGRPPEPTTGARLRALRAERGLSQRVLAAELARAHGGSVGAWQVDVSRYERDEIAITPERLRQLLEVLEVSDEARCQAEVGALISPSVIGRLVDTYGADMVAEAVARQVGIIIETGRALEGIRMTEAMTVLGLDPETSSPSDFIDRVYTLAENRRVA